VAAQKYDVPMNIYGRNLDLQLYSVLPLRAGLLQLYFHDPVLVAQVQAAPESISELENGGHRLSSVFKCDKCMTQA